MDLSLRRPAACDTFWQVSEGPVDSYLAQLMWTVNGDLLRSVDRHLLGFTIVCAAWLVARRDLGWRALAAALAAGMALKADVVPNAWLRAAVGFAWGRLGKANTDTFPYVLLLALSAVLAAMCLSRRRRSVARAAWAAAGAATCGVAFLTHLVVIHDMADIALKREGEQMLAAISLPEAAWPERCAALGWTCAEGRVRDGVSFPSNRAVEGVLRARDAAFAAYGEGGRTTYGFSSYSANKLEGGPYAVAYHRAGDVYRVALSAPAEVHAAAMGGFWLQTLAGHLVWVLGALGVIAGHRRAAAGG
jgi:hypothetical protein